MSLTIDWKTASKTVAYRELKQRLIEALNELNTAKQQGRRPMHTKKGLYADFKKIIDRAKHIALHEKITFSQALRKMYNANRGYLSPYNSNCILSRLDRNNPKCWAQKLPHNKPPPKRGRKRMHGGKKMRWQKWRKEAQTKIPKSVS